MSRLRENKEKLLDGNYLSKHELKERLRKMDIELDNKDHAKHYYSDLYNRLINEYDRRMKIKSILDTDIIDHPEKNLNRKREREDLEDLQDNNTNGTGNKRRYLTRNDFEKTNDEDINEIENINRERFMSGNLSFEGFMEKIGQRLNSKSSRRESAKDRRKNSNNTHSPTIQNISVKNGNIGEMTFARPTMDEIRENNQDIANFTDNVETSNIIKRLDYADEFVYNVEMSDNSAEFNKVNNAPIIAPTSAGISDFTQGVESNNFNNPVEKIFAADAPSMPVMSAEEGIFELGRYDPMPCSGLDSNNTQTQEQTQTNRNIHNEIIHIEDIHEEEYNDENYDESSENLPYVLGGVNEMQDSVGQIKWNNLQRMIERSNSMGNSRNTSRRNSGNLLNNYSSANVFYNNLQYMNQLYLSQINEAKSNTISKSNSDNMIPIVNPSNKSERSRSISRSNSANSIPLINDSNNMNRSRSISRSNSASFAPKIDNKEKSRSLSRRNSEIEIPPQNNPFNNINNEKSRSISRSNSSNLLPEANNPTADINMDNKQSRTISKNNSGNLLDLTAYPKNDLNIQKSRTNSKNNSGNLLPTTNIQMLDINMNNEKSPTVSKNSSVNILPNLQATRAEEMNYFYNKTEVQRQNDLPATETANFGRAKRSHQTSKSNSGNIPIVGKSETRGGVQEYIGDLPYNETATFGQAKRSQHTSKSNSGNIPVVNKPEISRNNISARSPILSNLHIPNSISNEDDGRKSIPGSTKNIKQILNNIDRKNSNPISPRLGINPSMRIISPLVINSNQNLNSSGASDSRRSIIVSIRPNVNEFNQNESMYMQNHIPILNSIIKAYHSKDYSTLILNCIFAAGLLVATYYFIRHSSDIYHIIFDIFNKLDNNAKAFILGLIITSLGVLIYKYFNDTKYFQDLASQDYENIIELIKNNYQSEDHPLGLFESSFIRDFSRKHNLTEGAYKKKVLPFLKEIKDRKRNIIEREVLIQEQSHKVWDLCN